MDGVGWTEFVFGYKWCWVVGLVRVNKNVRESDERKRGERKDIKILE